MSFATKKNPFENNRDITDPLENSREISERHATLLVNGVGKREVTHFVNLQKQDAEEEAKALLLLRKSRQKKIERCVTHL
jgi:hypothetical protein